MNKQKTQRGFTLMELLIVIILLGILIAAGISSFTSSLKKSRDSRRKNDLRQIAISLETFNNDNGHYPLSNAEGQILGCTDGVSICTWGNSFQDATTIYMIQLPADTSISQRYFYYSPDGTYFQLFARLENTLDSDVPKNGQNQAREFGDLNCGTDTTSLYCNYGVSSANKLLEAGHTVLYE